MSVDLTFLFIAAVISRAFGKLRLKLNKEYTSM